MRASTVYDSSLIQLPKIYNQKGNITAINNLEGIIPFTIDRVYYLYDIPGGEGRGREESGSDNEELTREVRKLRDEVHDVRRTLDRIADALED
jgi:hypothetical protein